MADIEYMATTWLDEQTGPIDQPIAQGLDSLKRPDNPPFAVGRAPFYDAGLHGPHQVEGNDTEHLPGAVGMIGLHRQAIEREGALEFTVDILVGAAPAREVPERPSDSRNCFQIGWYGRMLSARLQDVAIRQPQPGGFQWATSLTT